MGRFCQENVASNGDVFSNGRAAFDAQFIGNDTFVHVAAFDEALFFAMVDDDLAYSMALRMKSQFST